MTDSLRPPDEVIGASNGPGAHAWSIPGVTDASGHDAARPVVPRQLPLAASGFTGRTEHLVALDALLSDDNVGAGAVVISALDGTAGVGKTALAVHWAHRVQHRFPDGTLHANLRGYGPGEPATPAEVLDGFLHALGVPPQRMSASFDARVGLYRSMLAGRRMLILLDNANTASQVRPLLPASPGCLVLVTSRAALTGLVVNDGATRVTLDLLTPKEATDLVRGILGHQRVDAEPEAVAELVRQCARLPLALRIAAGRAAAQPHLDIADLVAEIIDNNSHWDTLSLAEDEETRVRAVFDWSYRRLTAEPARVFRRLGLHPGPDFSLYSAAAVTGLSVMQTRKTLRILGEVHLVVVVSRDRYRLHDLLHAYAADRDDHFDERDRARRTLLPWYAHHAAAALRLLHLPIADWHPVLELGIRGHPRLTIGRADAHAWFNSERVNLVAAVREAERLGWPSQLALLLAYTTGTAIFWLGYWHDGLDIGLTDLAIARSTGDRVAESLAHLGLGERHTYFGHWDNARDHYDAALALARDLGNPQLEAAALNDLGDLCLEQQKRYTEVREHLLRALPLSIDAQRGRLEAVIEGNLSRACRGLGDHEEAVRRAELDRRCQAARTVDAFARS